MHFVKKFGIFTVLLSLYENSTIVSSFKKRYFCHYNKKLKKKKIEKKRWKCRLYRIRCIRKWIFLSTLSIYVRYFSEKFYGTFLHTLYYFQVFSINYYCMTVEQLVNAWIFFWLIPFPIISQSNQLSIFEWNNYQNEILQRCPSCSCCYQHHPSFCSFQWVLTSAFSISILTNRSLIYVESDSLFSIENKVTYMQFWHLTLIFFLKWNCRHLRCSQCCKLRAWGQEIHWGPCRWWTQRKESFGSLWCQCSSWWKDHHWRHSYPLFHPNHRILEIQGCYRYRMLPLRTS